MSETVQRMTLAQTLKCPVHVALIDSSLKLLHENGYFSKADVLEANGFEWFGDSIHWINIRRIIEEQEKIKMVPLAARFFNANLGVKGKRQRMSRPEERIANPGKYMAGGNGKKTHGYASVMLDNGALTIQHLQNYQGIRNGVGRAFSRYLLEVKKRDLSLPPTLEPETLPAPGDKDNEGGV